MPDTADIIQQPKIEGRPIWKDLIFRQTHALKFDLKTRK